MNHRSPLACVRGALDSLGEANEDQIVARSGLDRAMVRSCLEQLIRLGRVMVLPWKPGLPASACGMACCGGPSGADKGQPSAVLLYRLTENHQKTSISGA